MSGRPEPVQTGPLPPRSPSESPSCSREGCLLQGVPGRAWAPFSFPGGPPYSGRSPGEGSDLSGVVASAVVRLCNSPQNLSRTLHGYVPVREEFPDGRDSGELRAGLGGPEPGPSSGTLGQLVPSLGLSFCTSQRRHPWGHVAGCCENSMSCARARETGAI